MVIKGNGGEGKSQIGAVMTTLFGSNMKDGSIGKISENRFARADLEHILLCIDDDLRMEGLKHTNDEFVAGLLTALCQGFQKVIGIFLVRVIKIKSHI